LLGGRGGGKERGQEREKAEEVGGKRIE